MEEYTRENPSPRFKLLCELYRQIHESGLQGTTPAEVFSGKSLLPHIADVRRMIQHTGARSILDYGSGKGDLYNQQDIHLPNGEVIPNVREYWGVEDIRLYDPGVKEYAVRPECQFDGVVSTDVLEHIPEEDIGWILDECFGFACKFLYMNIASYRAIKMLPNGWNAHVTIRPPTWWRRKIEQAAARRPGKTYVFDVTQKHTGLIGSLVRRLTGTKLKLTRIERWK